jgi:alanyl-tRNA synthetase
MLGNFSFGDYFKRDAIRFAWEFLTVELGLDPKYLRASVFHEDDEARSLWREITGLSDGRIYGLGAHDNFWQMADTGPCGPCSEIFVDLAHIAADWRFPEGATGEWTELDREEFSEEAFVEGNERGRFLEIWNLVFMQFDRQEDGTLVPLPKPSVDTGMGLERLSCVIQKVTNNYHTDVFAALIEAAEKATGIEYRGKVSDESYWVELSGGGNALLLSHRLSRKGIGFSSIPHRFVSSRIMRARSRFFLLTEFFRQTKDVAMCCAEFFAERCAMHGCLVARRQRLSTLFSVSSTH